MLKIDDKYTIETDGTGCTLVFKETRQKRNKEGEAVNFTDNWYYGNIKQCLKAFIHKDLEIAEDIPQLLKRIDGLETLIKNLKL